MNIGIVFLLLALFNYVLDTGNFMVMGCVIIGICFIISDLGRNKSKDQKEGNGE